MSVILTEKARLKIEEIANECGEPYSVRVVLRGGGCAGVEQDLYFTDHVAELDEVFEFEGVSVIIDQFSLSLLGDFTLEYSDADPMNEGFKFLTDTTTRSSCGCGKSMGIV